MKIVTYNIHSGMDSNNKLTLNKISKYLKSLDCDVICLQEALYPQFVKLKVDLKMNGKFATNVNKPGMKFGVCTFAKENISSSSHIFLTSKKEQRGFLSIKICKEDRSINIINTHLGLDKHERYVQISEIIDYTFSLTGNIVICGDFNEKNISISNYNDMAVALNKYQIPTFEKSHARIDYIFSDKSLSTKDYCVEIINLSDHYPVIGII